MPILATLNRRSPNPSVKRDWPLVAPSGLGGIFQFLGFGYLALRPAPYFVRAHRKMLRFVILVLSILATPAIAERIADPIRVLENKQFDDCTGGGFFLWDSKKCLFKDDAIWLDGAWQKLEQKSWVVVRKKKSNAESFGDKEHVVYESNAITVHLYLTLLPARCDYDSEQCTYRNYQARFVVIRPSRPILKFDGVGYGGS